MDRSPLTRTVALTTSRGPRTSRSVHPMRSHRPYRRRLTSRSITPPESLSLFEPGREPSITPEGILRFTTRQHANGVAVVQVTAVDSGAEPNRSETVSLTITVNEVNDVPVAVPDEIDTDEDTILNIPSSSTARQRYRSRFGYQSERGADDRHAGPVVLDQRRVGDV